MRVLIVSQYYDPEPIPKPAELAQALQARGHQVHVITGLPNYPSGRLYPGFRFRVLSKEERSGVPIVRALTIPYHGSSLIGRFLNYCSFAIFAIIGSIKTPPCDVIYVWHPPLTIGLSASIIGLLKQAPFVYDVQDIWPDSMLWSGVMTNRWVIGLLHRLENFIYRRAKHLLVVTSGARNNLLKKGVPPDKVTVAPHWVNEDLLQPKADDDGMDLRQKFGLGNRMVVMFAGNIGLVQGLEAVLQCAELLREDPDIVFVLVGDGADRERLRSLARSLALPNVVFIDRQPLKAMPSFFACADALLVHLNSSELSQVSIPTKTLAYLAAGRPIIMAVDGASAELVTQARAGLVVPPENPKALAEAVLTLMKLSPTERMAMGENGRTFLSTEFARERILDQYESILRATCGNLVPHQTEHTA